MKYNIVFQDGRPVVVAGEKHPQDGGVLLDVPEDFTVQRAEDWRLDNGALVHDPLPRVETSETEPGLTLEERMAEMEEALDLILTGVTE